MNTDPVCNLLFSFGWTLGNYEPVFHSGIRQGAHDTDALIELSWANLTPLSSLAELHTFSFPHNENIPLSAQEEILEPKSVVSVSP